MNKMGQKMEDDMEIKEITAAGLFNPDETVVSSTEGIIESRFGVDWVGLLFEKEGQA